MPWGSPLRSRSAIGGKVHKKTQRFGAVDSSETLGKFETMIPTGLEPVLPP
ncbi:hypothetical protein RRSWK_06531 [Rhodopirellula sp. SWK7]|nr:hypothetical protein RRSWK_06531 [Rhodopirellula sp. SWK7]